MRANASEPPGGIRTASGRRKPAIPFWKLASAAFGYKRRTPRPRTSTVRALMAAPTCPARVAQAPHLSMAAPAPAPRPSRPGTLPLRARARTSPRRPHFPMSTPAPLPLRARLRARLARTVPTPLPHGRTRPALLVPTPRSYGRARAPARPSSDASGRRRPERSLSRLKRPPQAAARSTRRRCGIAPRRRKTFPAVKASLDSGRMLVSVR